MSQDLVGAGVDQEHNASAPEVDAYDVAIMGGGPAGLALALQLRKARPGTSIMVVERQPHPLPEAAHKVGESTVEIAAHYLRDVLGLHEHLREQQLNKYGLRFFFSHNGNEDITRRVEFGHSVCPPSAVGCYQLDRGRLENALGQEVLKSGIPFSVGKVEEVRLQPQHGHHRLRITTGEGQTREADARWIVDATGRHSLLKRQLGLAKKAEHRANAVWFRIGHPIDIAEWSDDPQWHGRIREGRRELSTNHLMGRGYWVWLIPLASDAISIGIVTDADIHPFDEMNRFERALAWLNEHEPQCARVIEQHRDKVLDFRMMKNYAYSCAQVYSDERWCLTGEAGVFLDPFYSPGFDMITISNGLVTDLITRELNGEDISEWAAIHNQTYLTLTDGWFKLYHQQYALMGNAKVMLAKIFWDTVVYWAVPALLAFHDKLRRLVDSPQTLMGMARFQAAIDNIQRFFREWDAIDRSNDSDVFISPYDFDFARQLHIGLAAGLSDTEFDQRFADNLLLMEQISGQLVSTVIAECKADPQNEAALAQVERWQNDGALMRFVEIFERESPKNPIGDAWITLKNPAR